MSVESGHWVLLSGRVKREVAQTKRPPEGGRGRAHREAGARYEMMMMEAARVQAIITVSSVTDPTP